MNLKTDDSLESEKERAYQKNSLCSIVPRPPGALAIPRRIYPIWSCKRWTPFEAVISASQSRSKPRSHRYHLREVVEAKRFANFWWLGLELEIRRRALVVESR